MVKGRRYLPALAVALLVLAAYGLRFAGAWLPSTLIRSAIYLSLFATWGVSVGRRVIQTQQRRQFMAIAALMVLWLVVRTAKYLLPNSHPVGRYCWYLYYIPMLFIPLLTALITAQLGRAEGYRLPAWTRWLFAVAGGIALLVLTNDLHGWVFVFPGGVAHYVDGDYRYGAGFLLPAVWRYGMLLTALALAFLRSRLPSRGVRLLAPVIPAALLVLYHLFYLLEFRWLRAAFGDLTVTESLLVICILESCLRVGLIPSNTRYAQLMHLCDIPMAIVDGAGAVVLASDTYRPLEAATVLAARQGPVELSGGLRLSAAPLQEGWVLWEDDVSALTALQKELETAREQLRRRNALQAEEYRTLRRRQDLMEKNRLYDLMQEQTAAKAGELGALLEELEEAAGPREDRLLARCALLGAYIKRRGNLALLAQSQSAVSSAELKLCLDESLRNLSMFGINADQNFALRGEMAFGRVILL